MKIRPLYLPVIAIFLMVFVQQNQALAQPVNELGSHKIAQFHFNSQDYNNALKEYLKLVKENPDNVEYNYMTGVCYLKSGYDHTKAIPYLERVVTTGKFENDAYYFLGKAYHHKLELDKAVKMLSKYIEGGLGKEATEEQVHLDIRFCENAREVIKYALDVSFENLGPKVNSIYPDFFPFVPIDESVILFNTRRDDGSAPEFQGGGYTSNIYRAEVENGVFRDAVPIGSNINSPEGSEQIVGLSADGETMLLYYDSYGLAGTLLMTNKVGDLWDDPEVLPENINSKGSQQLSACITPEKDAIYFASNRKDGHGGSDLYVSRKLPTGEWGPAQNLGPEINSPYDEDFPNLSSDGKSLYFSSKGHTSMGGFDIFKAKINPDSNRYMNPVNLGYPINTTHDDMNYRASRSGRYGYIASKREDSFGDFDLYRVTFNTIESELTAIRGLVRSTKPTGILEDLNITVTDNISGDVYGYYLPNAVTNRFIIILPPGEFNIFAEATGHDPVSRNVTVMDKSSFQAEIALDLVLPSSSR